MIIVYLFMYTAVFILSFNVNLCYFPWEMICKNENSISTRQDTQTGDFTYADYYLDIILNITYLEVVVVYTSTEPEALAQVFTRFSNT